MTAILANLTQVLNQSPQVSALAGGHLAAEEAARREAQAEASERFREVLTKTVSPLDETRVVTAVDPKARRESQRPRRGANKGARKSSPSEAGRGIEAAPDLFEPRPVIDVRI